MGKRERQQRGSSALTSRVFSSLSAVFLLGALVGCIFTVMAEENGAAELEEYLAQYFELLKSNGIDVSFGSVLWNQGRYFLCVALFSLSVIGVAVIPLLIGIRGFLFAFSCAVCYRLFGISGLWISLALFGLPAFFWYPGLLLVSTQGFFSSFSMIQHREGNNEKKFLWKLTGCRQMVCGTIFLLIAVILEYSVVPIVIGWIFQII